MARRGYDGASVSEIAKAAQLTPGLIHYHFKNKQEILLAALDILVSRHEQRLDQYLSEAPQGPAAQVSAFIDVHLGLGATADPEGLACWILLSGEALRQARVQEQFASAVMRLCERLQGLIESGIRVGAFEETDSAEAASAIVASIQGFFVLAAVARDLLPRGSAARSALKMAEGLLGAELPNISDWDGPE